MKANWFTAECKKKERKSNNTIKRKTIFHIVTVQVNKIDVRKYTEF